ncbi:hypothetical protein MMC14_004257 [Varicellaria rhodocarpa]|nr:hypothetical protein [Varicellaria rhodocarpa]
MRAYVYKRYVLPAAFIIILTTLFLFSRVSLEHIPHHKSHTPSGIDAETAATAVEAVAESADLTYPLFDYTYDQIAIMSVEKKLAKDPCIDVVLPGGGAEAEPGNGQTVLITGGAGFIGSNLVDRLLQLGYKVRIYDNLYTGFLRNVPLDHPDVEFVLGDILDRGGLSKAVDGVNFVFHLAAMSKVVPSLKSPDMARFCTESNGLGSWNVLDAVREKGDVKKVIYAASSTYYGNRPAPHKEDMAADFLTPYAASKYEGEIQMQMFDRLFQVPTISTRFFMVYGPRQPSTGAYAIVTGVFAKQAAENRPLTIEGDGSHYRDFIHVRDIVEGLILSQQAPNLRGDVVNLGTGSAFSVQDVANLVSSSQTHVDPRQNDLEGTLADTCKMKRLLNYKAKMDFKTEMAFMAKETMDGNVFMQPWLTPAHAMSAPHLLAPGTPVFKWPATSDDLDALLLALKHIAHEIQPDEKRELRQITVILFSTIGDNIEHRSDLLLNTVFSLVRFGEVKSYIVAATDDEALVSCNALNLPCYDARVISAATLLSDLISRSYDVHLARLGNSYVSSIHSTLSKLCEEHGPVDVLGANPQGDVFVRVNDRSRAALALWAQTIQQTMRDDGGEILFNIKQWPALDLKKATFSVERFCGSTWVTPSIDTTIMPSATLPSTVTSNTARATTPLASDSPISATVVARDAASLCDKKFYRAVGCVKPDSIGSAANVITALKQIGGWHLTECKDAAHCDRQQVVPLRWVSYPPDLADSGGIC